MQTQVTTICEATIEAVITKADGTVINLGVVDSYKRPWWRTLLNKFTRQS